MRRQNLWFGLLLISLFLTLVPFYELSAWPGGGMRGWITNRVAEVQCGPISKHLCMVDATYPVLVASLLTSGATCAVIFALYRTLQVWRSHRVGERTIPGTVEP